MNWGILVTNSKTMELEPKRDAVSNLQVHLAWSNPCFNNGFWWLPECIFEVIVSNKELEPS